MGRDEGGMVPRIQCDGSGVSELCAQNEFLPRECSMVSSLKV